MQSIFPDLRLARRKLCHIAIRLDQGNAPADIKKLLSAGYVLRIQAAGVDQDIKPLACSELLPLLDIFIICLFHREMQFYGFFDIREEFVIKRSNIF